MKKQSFFFIANIYFLILTTNVFAGATGKLTGYVNDNQGKPLAGVNIYLDGTAIGTASDENGRYLIMVDATVTPNSARITPADAIVIEELRQQLTDKNQQIGDLKTQLVTKDQQIDKLQQALDQEQQLHAASQKTIESKQLQIEDMSRNRSVLARIREVFIPSNT